MLLLGSCVFAAGIVDDGTVTLPAGLMSREILTGGHRLATTSIRVDGQEVLAGPIPEVLFTPSCQIRGHSSFRELPHHRLRRLPPRSSELLRTFL
jgi:hypothetical protein